MLATAHQFQLYLILNVLDVQCAARGHTALKGRNYLSRQVSDCSWIRLLAAAVPPSTAKKALVIATVILLSSNGTTVPFL